ncbi:MAG: hypothetical protein P1U61_05445 [Legionellaceae bacterium]|nr:hypothetical protein [Legionellaceae bacterium]
MNKQEEVYEQKIQAFTKTLSDAESLNNPAEFAHKGSKMAYDIQTFLDDNPDLPSSYRSKFETVLFLTDDIANAPEQQPIYIREGIQMEKILQKTIDEATRLQTTLQSKSEGHLITAASRNIYQEAIEQVKTVKQAALSFQTQHAVAKEAGEAWIPTPENQDYQTFQALTESVQDLAQMTDMHQKKFEHGLFDNIMIMANTLLETMGFKRNTTTSMREQIRGIKKDIDETAPSQPKP